MPVLKLRLVARLPRRPISTSIFKAWLHAETGFANTRSSPRPHCFSQLSWRFSNQFNEFKPSDLLPARTLRNPRYMNQSQHGETLKNRLACEQFIYRITGHFPTATLLTVPEGARPSTTASIHGAAEERANSTPSPARTSVSHAGENETALFSVFYS